MSEVIQMEPPLFPIVARKSLPSAIWQSLWISLSATIFSMVVPMIFHWAVWSDFVGSSSAWIQTLAVFTSFGSTWMCVTQYRFNYVWGVISTALLVIVFAQQHLYGSMLQNIYLVPTLIYGWFIWKSDKNTRPVKHTTPQYFLIFLGLTAVLYVATFFTLRQFSASLLFWDTIILVGSIFAQWLLDRKYIENWIIWFIVDVIATIEYWHAGLQLVAIQFALFGINAVVGYIQWYKSMKRNRTFHSYGIAGDLDASKIDMPDWVSHQLPENFMIPYDGIELPDGLGEVFHFEYISPKYQKHSGNDAHDDYVQMRAAGDAAVQKWREE